jgi:hypothetical protein
MLSEDDVVSSVCDYLKQNGYRVVSSCTTKQQGVDIIAEHLASKSTLRVEAKGETSNDPSSKRFGKPFDNAQVSSHVAGAFYAASAMLNSDRQKVAMAFPSTELHRRHVSRIAEAIRRLEIVVFWVKADRSVSVESTHPL